MKICVNRKQFFLFVIFILLDLFIIGSVTTHADENVINDKIHRGEWARYGNLQYGFSAVDSNNSNAGLAADIQLVQDNMIIRHQYQTNNYLYSTTGFNLWTPTNIEGNYGWVERSIGRGGFSRLVDSKINFDASSVKKTRLSNGTYAISASTVYNDIFLVTCVIFPDIESGNISVSYEVQNNSTSNQIIYPSKGVDTKLYDNDDVPLYSIGPNKGIYMVVAKNRQTYRMDYSMSYSSNPLNKLSEFGSTPYYAAGILRTDFGNSRTFDKNYLNPNTNQMLVADGGTLLARGDTSIFMYWGEKTLKPGESFYGGYKVGLRDDGSFTITHKMSNQSSIDGKNYPNNSITYNSVIKIPEGNSYKNTLYTFEIPKYVSDPSKITVDGKEQDLNSVYDKTTRIVNLPMSTLARNSERDIKIDCKIASDASKQIINSAANMTGTDEIGKIQTISAQNSFYVEERKVAINSNYLDENKQEISSKVTKEVESNTTNSISAKKIPGYKVTGASVNGIETTLDANNSVKVSVKDRDTSVVFHYQSIHFGETTPLLEVNKKNVSLSDTLNYKLSVKSGMVYSAGETPKNFSNFKVTIPMDTNLENVKNIQLKLSDGTVVGTGAVDAKSNAIVATLSKDVKDTENLFLTYDASVKKSAVIGAAIKQTAEVKADFDANGVKTYSVQSNTVESTVERQLAVKINYLDTEGKKIADPISKIGFVGATYDYTTEMKKVNKYKFPPKVDEKNDPISGTFERNKDVTINLVYDLDLAKISIKFENDSGVDMSKYNYSFSTQFGENIDLSSNNEINKRVTEIKQAGYSVTPPDNAKNFPVDDHDITTRYKVAGKLELKEWPSEIDFGTQKVSTTKKNYWPTMKNDLIVRDTRGTKNSPWQLTVSETTPLTTRTTKLEGALSYQTSTSETPETLNKSAVIVEDNTHASDVEFNISQDWGKENGKGIKATIPVEQQRTGTYKGTLSWSLVSAPGNP